jgi:pimeloyl-ACP methyl ester carboxylesterase
MKKQLLFWLSACLFCFAGIKQVAVGQTKKVRANGIDIAYESFGPEKGETILLTQGTGAQLTGWPQQLCEQLAREGYRVIRFDNRDVGLSSRLDSLGMPDWGSIFQKIGTCDVVKLPYTLHDMAKDAVGLMSALEIKKAHIVGASMGGAIAQLVAIHFPERTLSLTSIMASSGNPALPQGNPEVLKVMAIPPPDTDDVEVLSNYLFTIYKALGSPAYPTEDNILKEMARKNIERCWYPIGLARQASAIIIGDHCDRREQLKKISVPVVVIHGEADPVVSVEAGREVAATIPNAKLITISGMGHDLPIALISKIRDGILMATKQLR